MNFLALILVAGGVFSICGAVFNWDWFMTHRKARLLVTIFSRNGARVFYVLIGLVLVVMGILAALGIIEDGSR